MSEFIVERINIAHAMLDEYQFEECVNLLKNIKHRVHEPEVSKEINQFENGHDEKLKEHINRIETSNADPLRKNADLTDIWRKYAQSYLSFYDKLSKDYDI